MVLGGPMRQEAETHRVVIEVTPLGAHEEINILSNNL